jgi:hypothetical protein
MVESGDELLEHIPFGWNQPNGICLLQQLTPVRAFPVRWNRTRFHLTGNRSSIAARPHAASCSHC